MSKQIVEVRATADDHGHTWLCKEGEASYFTVNHGWLGDMKWIADFASKDDALDYARYRAIARKCEFLNCIGQGC